MDKEKQRIKIAEACGWTSFEKSHGYAPHPTGIDPLDSRREDLPDYLDDLNAMHEAEKAKFNENYWLEWEGVVARMSLPRGALPLTIWIACMTAPQRAEAFLRTLNLWEQ